MTAPFLPTKTEWDRATAQLNAIRLLFGLLPSEDVVPHVQALLELANTQRALHMEQELAAIRNLFAHLAPSESVSAYELCQHVLALHANQAQTIQSFLAKYPHE